MTGDNILDEPFQNLVWRRDCLPGSSRAWRPHPAPIVSLDRGQRSHAMLSAGRRHVFAGSSSISHPRAIAAFLDHAGLGDGTVAYVSINLDVFRSFPPPGCT